MIISNYKYPPRIKEKTWGREIIFSPVNAEYTGKILEFKEWFCSSNHFHLLKSEDWRILSGVFDIKFTENGVETRVRATQGDCFHIWPGLVHKVFCLEAGSIMEVSTKDYDSDNYRLDKSGSFSHHHDSNISK